jgi:hypothetical protein
LHYKDFIVVPPCWQVKRAKVYVRWADSWTFLADNQRNTVLLATMKFELQGAHSSRLLFDLANHAE